MPKNNTAVAYAGSNNIWQLMWLKIILNKGTKYKANDINSKAIPW